MELSEAKEIVKDFLSWDNKKYPPKTECEAIEVVLKALDNSVSKDEVRKLYEEHKKILRHYDNCNLEQDDTYHECIKVCDVLLELLGE